MILHYYDDKGNENMNSQNATPPQPPPRRRAYSMGQPRSAVLSNQVYPRRSTFDAATNYVILPRTGSEIKDSEANLGCKDPVGIRTTDGPV
ncbi:hypothetical protein Bhyg_07917, partial [Pseudolycoriella hygida]